MTFVLDSELLSYLNLLVAFVLPVAVAFVTDRYASSRYKAAALLVLTSLQAALFAFLDGAVEGAEVSLSLVISLFVNNLVVAIAAHFGVTKPLGVTGSQSAIAGSGLRVGSGEKGSGI